MPNTAVITVEGVMQKTVSYAPIPTGIALYHALSSVFNVVLISDDDRERLEFWLNLEGLTKHGTVVYNDDIRFSSKSAEERRVGQCNGLRARGFYIDLVVEPSPTVASRLLASGYSVLHFLHTSYALPQWRPDFESKVKPWEELERTATELALLRSEDARLAIKKEAEKAI